jgi:hypothetical protein
MRAAVGGGEQLRRCNDPAVLRVGEVNAAEACSLVGAELDCPVLAPVRGVQDPVGSDDPAV